MSYTIGIFKPKRKGETEMKKYVINEISEIGNVHETERLKVTSQCIAETPREAIWLAALFAENAEYEMKSKGWEATDIGLFENSVMVSGIAYRYEDDGTKIQRYWNRRFEISAIGE